MVSSRTGPDGAARQRGWPRPTRAGVCTAAALALLVPWVAGTAQAAPRAAEPTGSWRATVVREGAQYDVRMSFAADRSVCLDSPAGASKGSWSAEGAEQFGYRIRELWYDDSGAVEGWVDIDQSARLDGASFEGSGESTVFRPDGTVDSTVPVSITAVRTGPPDGSACS